MLDDMFKVAFSPAMSSHTKGQALMIETMLFMSLKIA
jgi:hypothetical protein